MPRKDRSQLLKPGSTHPFLGLFYLRNPLPTQKARMNRAFAITYTRLLLLILIAHCHGGQRMGCAELMRFLQRISLIVVGIRIGFDA